MDITLHPVKLSGTVTVPPSKSIAHRMLIYAALADHPTDLVCPETGDDINATIDCLQALGADILLQKAGYHIVPIAQFPESADLYCRESGSTLRFLLPIVGALGVSATFHMEGRLPQRPLSPLIDEMQRMGCHITRPTNSTIFCTGKLRCGYYQIDGSVSSQFISGLTMALPLISGESHLEIIGNVESKPYIDMTTQVANLFTSIPSTPIIVEGDWSNAAFWLAASALGSQISIDGIARTAMQGDQQIVTLLPKILHAHQEISGKDIPDLIPILAVVAAATNGATFTNISRLRTKESDRVAAIINMVCSLGGKAEATEDTLTIYATGLVGGTVDSYGDHRIAMSAAIAATVCSHPVTIQDGQCVKKSYPGFWQAYHHLSNHTDLRQKC